MKKEYSEKEREALGNYLLQLTKEFNELKNKVDQKEKIVQELIENVKLGTITEEELLSFKKIEEELLYYKSELKEISDKLAKVSFIEDF